MAGHETLSFYCLYSVASEKKYRSYNQMHNILNAAELSVVFSLFTDTSDFFPVQFRVQNASKSVKVEN